MVPSERGHASVSVLVPAFNEEPGIQRTLGILWDYLIYQDFDFELVVVDDGSTDETGKLTRRFADEHPNVVFVEHVANLGLGQAIKSGLRAASNKYLVTIDSDLSYDPSHIKDLISTIHSTGARVVVASPYMDGGSVQGVPRLRAMLSRYANRLLKRLSISKVSTVTGMVRAYDREFLEGISLKSVDNQINAEIVYKTSLLREPIVEIPARLVWTRDKVDTRRRRKAFSLFRTTQKFLFSGFIFRPFSFFILPGSILFLLALYSLGWAGYHVLRFLPEQSGNLDEIISGAAGAAFAASPHSFLIGGMALIFAFQLISLGILSAQNKRYFEEVWFQGNWLYRRLSSETDDEKELAAE